MPQQRKRRAVIEDSSSSCEEEDFEPKEERILRMRSKQLAYRSTDPQFFKSVNKKSSNQKKPAIARKIVRLGKSHFGLNSPHMIQRLQEIKEKNKSLQSMAVTSTSKATPSPTFMPIVVDMNKPCTSKQAIAASSVSSPSSPKPELQLKVGDDVAVNVNELSRDVQDHVLSKCIEPKPSDKPKVSNVFKPSGRSSSTYDDLDMFGSDGEDCVLVTPPSTDLSFFIETEVKKARDLKKAEQEEKERRLKLERLWRKYGTRIHAFPKAIILFRHSNPKSSVDVNGDAMWGYNTDMHRFVHNEVAKRMNQNPIYAAFGMTEREEERLHNDLTKQVRQEVYGTVRRLQEETFQRYHSEKRKSSAWLARANIIMGTAFYKTTRQEILSENAALKENNFFWQAFRTWRSVEDTADEQNFSVFYDFMKAMEILSVGGAQTLERRRGTASRHEMRRLLNDPNVGSEWFSDDNHLCWPIPRSLVMALQIDFDMGIFRPIYWTRIQKARLSYLKAAGKDTTNWSIWVDDRLRRYGDGPYNGLKVFADLFDLQRRQV